MRQRTPRTCSTSSSARGQPPRSARGSRRWRCSCSPNTSRPYALRLLEGTEQSVGYLLKDRILDAGQLTDAITRVIAGGLVVDPALVAQLLDRPRRADPLAELTSRERDVLGLMAEGLIDRGIAQRLYVTPKTVKTQARHIFQKLRLSESALDNKRVRAVLTYLRA